MTATGPDDRPARSAPANSSAASKGSLAWLAAPISCITIVAISGTLSYPLIALLLERAGESGARIGLNTAMASLGILGFGLIGHIPLGRLGVTRFFLVCLAVLAASLAVFPLFDSFIVWCISRFVLGAATAGLFLASEYWVIAAAPEGRRGRLVALYALSLSAGYALGPTILLGTGVEGWPPFAAAIGLVALAAIPVVFARSVAPSMEQRHAAPALRYFTTDPTLLWAVVLFGAVEFGAMALTPVWAVRVGYSEETGVSFAIAIAVGALVFQPALGWAADRFPPRPLLIAAALTCVAVATMLPMIDHLPIAIMAVAAIWGAMAAGLYTVSLTAIGGRYTGADLASANAAFVFAYGLGAFIGPALVGAGLDVFGPNGLPMVIAGLSAPYLALAVYRGLARADER